MTDTPAPNTAGIPEGYARRPDAQAFVDLDITARRGGVQYGDTRTDEQRQAAASLAADAVARTADWDTGAPAPLPLVRDTFAPTLVLVLITDTTHAAPRHLSLHTTLAEARRTFIDAANALHHEVAGWSGDGDLSFEVARDRVEDLGFTVVVEDTPVSLS